MTTANPLENKDYVVFDGSLLRTASSSTYPATADYGLFQGSRFRGRGNTYRGSFRMIGGSGFTLANGVSKSTRATARYTMPASATHGGALRWENVNFSCYNDNFNFRRFTFEAKYTPSKPANVQYPTDLQWVAEPADGDEMDCWVVWYKHIAGTTLFPTFGAFPQPTVIKYPVTVSHDGNSILLSSGDISETGLVYYDSAGVSSLTKQVMPKAGFSWSKWVRKFAEDFTRFGSGTTDPLRNNIAGFIFGNSNYRDISIRYTIVLAKRGIVPAPWPPGSSYSPVQTRRFRDGFEPYVWFTRVPVHAGVPDFTNRRQFGNPLAPTLGDRTDRILLTWRQGVTPDPAETRYELQYRQIPSLTGDWTTLEAAYVDSTVAAGHTHRYYFYPGTLNPRRTLTSDFEFRIRAARAGDDGQPNPLTWSNYATTAYYSDGLAAPILGLPYFDEIYDLDFGAEEIDAGHDEVGYLEQATVALFGMTPGDILLDYAQKVGGGALQTLEFASKHIWSDEGYDINEEYTKPELLPTPADIAQGLLHGVSFALDAVGNARIGDHSISSNALPVLSSGARYLGDYLGSSEGFYGVVGAVVGRKTGLLGQTIRAIDLIGGNAKLPEPAVVQKFFETADRTVADELEAEQRDISERLKSTDFDTQMVALYGGVWYNEKRRKIMLSLISD